MKTTLKQLTEMFGQYALSDENPPEVRQFAAQLAILSEHVNKINQGLALLLQKMNTNAKAVDGQVVELAQHILELKKATGPAPSPKAPTPPPQTDAPSTPENPAEGLDEEAATAAMVRQAQLDTEADAAAMRANSTQQANGQQGAAS